MASQIEYGVDIAGVDRASVTVSWSPVSESEDGSEMDIQSYVVETSPDAVVWKPAATAAADSVSAVLRDLVVPSVFWVRVRAVGVNGVPADPSEVEYIELVPDVTPPPVASTPSVSARLGVLSVTWNGLFVAPGIRPADFRWVQVHVSATSGFTPSAATLQGTLSDAGTLAVGGLGYGTYFVVLVATDIRGNAAAPSSQASAAVEQLVLTGDMITELDGAKIKVGTIPTVGLTDGAVTATKIAAMTITASELAANSITSGKLVSLAVTTAKLDALAVTADKIAVNAITADKVNAGAITGVKISGDAIDGKTITGPVIRSSAPGSGLSRWEADTYGIRLLNAAGAATVDLNATSGEAVITGEIRTAATTVFPRFEVVKDVWAGEIVGGDGANLVRAGLRWKTHAQASAATLACFLDKDTNNLPDAQSLTISPGWSRSSANGGSTRVDTWRPGMQLHEKQGFSVNVSGRRTAGGVKNYSQYLSMRNFGDIVLSNYWMSDSGGSPTYQGGYLQLSHPTTPEGGAWSGPTGATLGSGSVVTGETVYAGGDSGFGSYINLPLNGSASIYVSSRYASSTGTASTRYLFGDRAFEVRGIQLDESPYTSNVTILKADRSGITAAGPATQPSSLPVSSGFPYDTWQVVNVPGGGAMLGTTLAVGSFDRKVSYDRTVEIRGRFTMSGAMTNYADTIYTLPAELRSNSPSTSFVIVNMMAGTGSSYVNIPTILRPNTGQIQLLGANLGTPNASYRILFFSIIYTLEK